MAFNVLDTSFTLTDRIKMILFAERDDQALKSNAPFINVLIRGNTLPPSMMDFLDNKTVSLVYGHFFEVEENTRHSMLHLHFVNPADVYAFERRFGARYWMAMLNLNDGEPFRWGRKAAQRLEAILGQT